MDIQNLVIIAHLSIIFSLATAQKQCFPPKELAPLEWVKHIKFTYTIKIYKMFSNKRTFQASLMMGSTFQ